jgi:hydroxymethylpyrimidine pyrophosphatase-like HAD family hydrolase
LRRLAITDYPMKFHVLAVDYDGCLADNGNVDAATVESLVRLRQSGRRLVLVTGRLLKPLLDAFPEVGLCDLVVAENGALLYNPDTREERQLAETPPREFEEKLVERGVPVSEVGRVIVVTRIPYETLALETILDMSLELQIIFNKGAVMMLPTGVNKASGLRAALKELGLSPHNAVGIGDAENDEAFLELCEARVAVDNALDALKKRTDLVTSGKASAGVAELIEKLIADDLQELHSRPGRGILLGTRLGGENIWVPIYGTRLLVTGESATGKSKLAVSILDQLIRSEYQACVFDPEGDFQSIDRAIVIGTPEQSPIPEEVMQVVRQPNMSCIISLFATKTVEQPALFSRLYLALQDHRVRTGRPHWNIVDEAQYPIPASWAPIDKLHLEDWHSVMYVTAFPQQMPRTVLRDIDLFVALGDNPAKLLAEYCDLLGVNAPELTPPEDPEKHRAVAWWRGKGAPFWFRRLPPRGEHQRHRHQYFDGNMDAANRFYFRGPKGLLNLGTGNLRTFLQLAEGVDDETWKYHLRRGDYARWFRNAIQDDVLAAMVEQVERMDYVSATYSRKRITEIIQKLYAKEL